MTQMQNASIVVFNTDEKHSPGAGRRMLEHGVVGVWGADGKQRDKLESAGIGVGDIIYAYQSGLGAIARGVVTDDQIRQAPTPDPVFPECTDGDSWFLSVDWTPLPGPERTISHTTVLEQTGERLAVPQSIYRKRDRALIRFLNRKWNVQAEPREHAALLCNPDVYDVLGASRALEEDTWALPRGSLEVGDRVAFWQTSRDRTTRGVVALAEVVESPADRPCEPTSAPFWRATMPTDNARRVVLRYLRVQGGPVFLGDRHDQLLLQPLRLQGTGQQGLPSPELDLAGARSSHGRRHSGCHQGHVRRRFLGTKCLVPPPPEPGRPSPRHRETPPLEHVDYRLLGALSAGEGLGASDSCFGASAQPSGGVPR